MDFVLWNCAAVSQLIKAGVPYIHADPYGGALSQTSEGLVGKKQGKNRMLLFAQLQSGIESGREVEFRSEAGYRIESACAYKGEIACRCQRSYDDAGEQPKTRRFILSRPTRKICRLKLFNDRADNVMFLQKLCRVRLAVIIVAAISILVTGSAIASDHAHIHEQERNNPDTFNNVVNTNNSVNRYKITNAYYAIPPVNFISNTGQHVKIDELLSSPRPVLLQFIYSTCTTICPVLSATFSQAQDELSKINENFLLISVSIDPEHDNVQKISDYAKRHNAGNNWIFLTGDNGETRKLLKAFDVLYPGYNKMNHQSTMFLRVHPDAPWRRIDGFLSIDKLMAEFTEPITPVKAAY